MRVIVCGGRDYDDYPRVRAVLDAHDITEIATGGAPGADDMADTWACWRDMPRRTFPALWAKHGRAAGPLRNAQMLREFAPDAVIAFPGGRGTADMIRQARAAGVRVIEIPHTADAAGEEG